MSFSDLQHADFNDPDLDSSDGFAPVPNGTYSFEVVEGKVETSQSGYNQIVMQCKITGPSHAGRMVFERFITGHQDGRPTETQQKAINIGRARLKQLCELNRLNRWPKDDREVVGWLFSATLDYREYNGKWYEDLKKYKAANVAQGKTSPSAAYLAAKKEYEEENGDVTSAPQSAGAFDDAPF